MRFVQNIAARSGIFYGWFTLVGVMLIVFTVGGSFVNSFGVMLPVICEKFGWSRASVSAGLSIGVIAFGLPSPLFGMLVAKFGARFAFILGNILAAIGIAGMSLIQQVWHIYILYLLIGLGAGFGGYITSATVVNNWFIEKTVSGHGPFCGQHGVGRICFPTGGDSPDQFGGVAHDLACAGRRGSSGQCLAKQSHIDPQYTRRAGPPAGWENGRHSNR